MKRIFCFLLLAFSTNVFAGGELPFPFDDPPGLPILESHSWLVDTTNLLIQMRVYQDDLNASTQWIRIWVRGDDGFVYKRIRLVKTGDGVDVKFLLKGMRVEINLDFTCPAKDVVVIDEQRLHLTEKVPVPSHL